MDRRKYSFLRKMKKDKKLFDKKLDFYESKISYDQKIKYLTSEIKKYRTEKEEIMKASNSSDIILKIYIAELNAKIFPNTWYKNYGENNIKLNLSNIAMLSYLQKIKKEEFIKDKYKLEDEVIELFQKMDKKQTKQIKTQIEDDKIDAQIMENEKHQLSLIKDNFRIIAYDIEKYENYLKHYKLQYDIVMRIYKRLQEKLKIEKIKSQKLSELCEQKNIKKNYKNLKIEINDNLQKNEKFKSFSDKNFLSVENTRRNSLKLFEGKKNKYKMNPYLIKNYKGYQTPLFFLKKYKKFDKKLNDFSSDKKLLNAYDFLNIFSNNNKCNTISDFINSFNSFNNTKLTFNSASQEFISTKKSTLSSNNSILKSLSSNNSKNKGINKKNKIRNKMINTNSDNEMSILREYLYNLIDEQNNIIKFLKNKKAEEIRSVNQIKTFISKCIDDLNNEIYENKNKDNEMNNIDRKNETLVNILSYIFDNCFKGINNDFKSIFPEFRNTNKNKIRGNFIDNIKRRCFSSTNIRQKK